MTLIRRPSGFGDVLSLREAMERLFDDRFFRPLWTATLGREAEPALDLYTTPEAVIAKVALPGVKPDDVDIQVADDMVTIAGSFKEEKETTEAGYVCRELSRGSFHRTFPLPAAVRTDAATATFVDGMLTLTLPKTEQAKPTHIRVRTK
jgi:HSP20 family protein